MSDSLTTSKPYDGMTKEERAAHDTKERQREREEQATLPYQWTQDLTTVSVTVPLPPGTRDGQLFNEISKDDSSWTIDNGTMTIELEKLSAHIKSHQWWPHVLTHHPKIDTTKIQPENSKLSDLDAETRGMVEKMMFDNQQKAMGKPSSDELKKLETIEKFKKMHPEMDFSNATMT